MRLAIVFKCGKTGNLARECRTGWEYEAQAAVKLIEGKKRSREEKGKEGQRKKRLVDQHDGGIRTIASRIESASANPESGND